MITKFDIKDRSTWPELDQPILFLAKTDNNEQIICAGCIEKLSPTYFDVLVTGIGGWDYENEFELDDIIAWQPLPSFGDFNK